MYTNLIKMQDEAVCHLFFYCCMKDGVFKESEIDNVSGKFVAVGLHKHLNFKDEMMKYKSYKQSVTDEMAYLQYLIGLIKPVNELALYSYCMELCISDGELSAEEDELLNKIAGLLTLNEPEKTTVEKLIAQRRVMETEKIF